jgi:hypothetical protein
MRLLESRREIVSRCPPERGETRGIQGLTRRAIRLRAIEHEFALIAHYVSDEVGELGDRDFLAGADINVLLGVIVLEQKDECIGEIIDVHELA